jgi:hypothetical protein
MKLRQRNFGSVRELLSQFQGIILEIPNMTEDEKIERLVECLNRPIAEQVEMQRALHNLSFVQVAAVALKLDFIQDKRSSQDSVERYSYDVKKPAETAKTQGTTDNATATNAAAPMELDVMTRTNSNKKLSYEEKEELKKKGACFKCKKVGHISRWCQK